MGLDVVELVLECEDAFAIQLEDWRLEQMTTVGDLFELICEQLGLPLGRDQPQSATRAFLPLIGAPREGWSREAVWEKLVRIVVDQLQIEPEDVTYSARFGAEFGAD